MANNPLYPGYSPGKKDEESVNPLYPGYYAGKPLPKRPQSKDFVKPIEFDLDNIMQEIDNIAESATEAPLAGPRWIKKRVMDDWKNQLKISVSSSHSLDPTELDDYSVIDFPGVSLELSLNPDEWGLNPKDDKEKRKAKFKKQLKKTINKWTKETTGVDPGNLLKPDFSDFNNLQEEWAWTHAMGYGDPEEPIDPTKKLAIESVGGHVTAGHKDYWEETSPLNIKGVNVKVKRIDDIRDPNTGKVTGRKEEIRGYADVYRDTATAIGEFENQKGNVKSRDSKYNDIMKNATDAVSKELEHHYLNSDNNNVRRIFDSHAGEIAFFDTQKEILDNVYSTDESLDGVRKKLRKNQTVNEDGWRSLESNINKSISTAREKLERVEDLYSQGRLNERAYNRFKQDTSIYINFLDKRKGAVSDAASGKISGRQALYKLEDKAGRGLTRTESFNESVAGRFQKGIEDSMRGTKKGDIGNLLRDSDLKANGVNLRARALIPMIDRTRQDRIYNTALEFLNDWDSENVLEKFVWNRVIKRALPERLEAWTAGTVVRDRLEKSNYFGLKITDKGSPNNEWAPAKKAEFNRRYGYRVNMSLDRNVFGIDKLELNGGGKEFSLLDKKLKNNDDFKLHALQYFKLENKPENKDERLMFAKLLNGNTSDELKLEISDLISNKRFGMSFNELGEFQRNEINTIISGQDGLIDQAKYFREWSKQKLGSREDPDSPAFIAPLSEYRVNLLSSGLGLENVLIKRDDLDKLKIFSNPDINLFDFSNGKHTQQLKKMLVGKEVSLDDMSKVFFGNSKFGALSTEEQQRLRDMMGEFSEFRKWMEGLPDDIKSKLVDGTSRLELFKALKSSDFKDKFKDAKYIDPTTETSMPFLLFEKIQEKNASLSWGYKLHERKYIGKLEKFHSKLQNIQNRINSSFVGKAVRLINNWRDIIAKKASEVATKLLAKVMSNLLGAAAASTGVLAVLMPVIKAVAEKTIKKVIVYGEAALKAVYKLDMSELEEMLMKDVKKLLTSCMIIVLAIFSPIILMASILMIIIGGTVSPADMSEVGVENFGEQAANFVGQIPGNCTPSTFDPGDVWYYYAQCHPDWYTDPIGTSDWTVGNAGCLLTSRAMVYKFFCYNVTPKHIASISSGFTSDGNMLHPEMGWWDEALYNAGVIDTMDSGITYENLTYSQPPSSNISKWKEWFENNHGLIIIGINNDAGTAQHWVVISGYDSIKNDFILQDPWSGPNKYFLETYSSFNIIGARGYSGDPALSNSCNTELPDDIL
ncbi:C39 family peptidase [Patescibacteria group bacterium]|nr:C39 family peptidase [Patescibacteria group bacterium]